MLVNMEHEKFKVKWVLFYTNTLQAEIVNNFFKGTSYTKN